MAIQNPTAEEWRAVVGHPRYEVSSLGRVRSLDMMVQNKPGRRRFLKPGRILSPCRLRNGYILVTMAMDGVLTRKPVHHLVLCAFVRPPERGEECDHKDFNPSNNRLDNLRWMTHLENVQHSNAAGRKPRGERSGVAKLDNGKIRFIRERHAGGQSAASIARELGVSGSAVWYVVTGRTWSHVA